MDAFIKKIQSKISVDYLRLSIIRNPDGFLADKAVQNAINQECGIEFVSGTQIQLRVHFELEFKKNPDQRYCYLCEDTSLLLPDMTAEAYLEDFSVSDIFPNFGDKQLIRRQPYDVLRALYREHIQGIVTMAETRRLIDEVAADLHTTKQRSAEDYVQELTQIVPDWNNLNTTIHNIAAIAKAAIKDGVYDDIEPVIGHINDSFQGYISNNYFGALHTNPLLKARSVNNILPHIAANHSLDDKLALVVVDGMSYWQYLALKAQLEKSGISVADETTLAWLPTITMLSRQAIFRGSDPLQDYKQNPQNEAKLWKQFWTDKGVPAADIQYIYDGDDLVIESTTKRLALVTAEIDDDMHTLKTNEDLLAVTDNWAKRFTKRIRTIKDAGFAVYITTDHGNVLSHGWRALTSLEKTHLYEDGSRGARHLIYNNLSELRSFVVANPDIGMLEHGNWLVFRNSKCLCKAQTNIITHGGSHFFEVLIPFAKI